MNPQDIERAFSIPRFDRFVLAAKGDMPKALDLYRSNVRLSFKLFAILSVFEVVLRNAIDSYYTTQFGHDWLLNQIGASGFLAKKGCEKSRENVSKAIQNLGSKYTHDKTVASLSFSFWRYLFASKEFAAAGYTLLNVFPFKPRGITYNHTYVFSTLYEINEIRNRIAHHEPICFAPNHNFVSCWPCMQAYMSICELLKWLDFMPQSVLKDIDFVITEMKVMAKL